MHTLVLIHGMGEHPEGSWHEPLHARLRELSQRYKWFRKPGNDLDSHLRVVPIGYDKWVQEALQRWERAGRDLGQLFGPDKLFDAGSLPDLSPLGGAAGDFVLTHVLDVLIYRFLKLERGHIQSRVAEELTRVARNSVADSSSTGVSIMAHSLGTAVMHDALAKLYTVPDIDGQSNPFAKSAFKFRSLHMVANVSRLLQSDFKAYESKVRPGASDSKSACCEWMYSYRHELDPIARPKAFEPADWSRYWDVSLRNISAWNVHDWLHYLDDPVVHVRLFNRTMPRRAVSKAEFGAAVGGHPPYAGQVRALAAPGGVAERLAAALQRIPLDAELADALPQLVAAFNVLKEGEAVV